MNINLLRIGTSRLAYFLILIIFISLNLSADHQSDSIRKILPQLSGKKLLLAYQDLCQIASSQDNSKYELECLEEFRQEANRQNNVDKEAYARSAKLFCYYNYDLCDNLINELPEDLAFMRKHQLWVPYYESWYVLINLYIYQKKYLNALNELKDMYSDAREYDIKYGIGLSLSGMGDIYLYMQNAEQAAKHYESAIKILKETEELSVLFNVYSNYCDVLNFLKRYDAVLKLASAWKKEIDDYKIHFLNGDDKNNLLSTKYMYCHMAMAQAEMGKGNLDKAETFLKIADEYRGKSFDATKLALYGDYSRYYKLRKNYDKALEYNSAKLEINNDDLGLINTKKERADILMSAGREKEAAYIYQELLPQIDSLNNVSMQMQFNDICATYELDELNIQNERTKNKLYASICILIFLSFLLASYFIYTKRLRKKNRALFERISEIESAKQDFENIDIDVQDNESLLYQRICNLLNDNELFKNPLLNRDDLAENLATNRTYIADAIKRFSNGMTVSEFINKYRLHYAGSLLAHEISLPINEVSEKSGFNSRSTYNRLFREYFGMSPSEYRSIAKEKIKYPTK